MGDSAGIAVEIVSRGRSCMPAHRNPLAIALDSSCATAWGFAKEAKIASRLIHICSSVGVEDADSWY